MSGAQDRSKDSTRLKSLNNLKPDFNVASMAGNSLFQRVVSLRVTCPENANVSRFWDGSVSVGVKHGNSLLFLGGFVDANFFQKRVE